MRNVQAKTFQLRTFSVSWKHFFVFIFIFCVFFHVIYVYVFILSQFLRHCDFGYVTSCIHYKNLAFYCSIKMVFFSAENVLLHYCKAIF